MITAPQNKKRIPTDHSNAPEIDQAIESISQDVLNQEHPSAANQASLKLDQLCTLYSDLCNKTTREWSYTDQELLLYQLLVVYLVKQIDQRLVADTSLRYTLSVLKHFQDTQGRRGSAGHTNIKINTAKIPNYQEYWEVLTHEMGHIVDLGVVNGKGKNKNTSFTEFGQIQRANNDPSLSFYSISRQGENIRQKKATFKDFVSGYAMQGVYEDFAESINMYFNHHALFVSLAENNPALQQKLAFLTTLFGGSFFKDDAAHLSAMKSEERPRDTTKISSEG